MIPVAHVALLRLQIFAHVFYNVFGVTGRTLLTFSSLSYRALELVAPIVSVPQMCFLVKEY